MIGGALLSLLALIGVSAAVPHLLARNALRARLVRIDAISTGVLLAIWHVAAVLDAGVTPAVACGGMLAAKLLIFAAAFAALPALDELEWSPARAGLLAGLVYLALIPIAVQQPTDGDESFYVLTAESMLHDYDLDLRNQYDDLGTSVTGRLDLGPHVGDPVGPNGEYPSPYEPLLCLVLVPGIAIGGLPGAVMTIALFAALAVRAIVALLDEEGVGRRAQLFIVGFVALAPPFLSYAIRVWPEAPGVFLLAEALRAARAGRVRRAIILAVLLAAFKVRFLLLAATLVLVVLVAGRVRWKLFAAGVASVGGVVAAIAMLFPRLITGRTFDPRAVFVPENFAKGFLGLLIDGQAGLLFQAPLLLIGLAAILRWQLLGQTAKIGCIAALPYILLLVPRSEWHGGWSPPLRYLVIFLPLFALLLATTLERVEGGAVIKVAAAWTAALAVKTVAFPLDMFRIASGESALGEHLSRTWGSDLSRLIPSLIRPNEASMWYAVALVVVTAVVAIRRGPRSESRGPAVAAMAALLIAGAAFAGLAPGRIVEFEDQHVTHLGGELHPARWTMARFRFRGGWILRAGDSAGFRHEGGTVSLTYYCDQPTVIVIDGEAYEMPTGSDYADLVFVLPETTDDRHEIRCESGALILDRLATE